MIKQMQKVEKYKSPESLTTLKTTSFFSVVLPEMF
jgi:ribosomal protein S19